MRALDLVPISEFQLTTETIRRFRMGYVARSARRSATIRSTRRSAKAAAIPAWSIGCRCSRPDGHAVRLSAGRRRRDRAAGEDAARERFKQIADYYEARREALEHPGGGAIYKPLPPDRLYLTEDEWTKRLDEPRWRG
jgi:transcription-repair coupling factor (superfamily II helicase)